ncbi:MAG: hypothetical protein V8Q27_06120 [Eubacteriales bacterium]
MNEKIKELAEQYAAQASVEQKELLKTLGVIPAPSIRRICGRHSAGTGSEAGRGGCAYR